MGVIYENSSGEPIEDAFGNPIECTNCPCISPSCVGYLHDFNMANTSSIPNTTQNAGSWEVFSNELRTNSSNASIFLATPGGVCNTGTVPSHKLLTLKCKFKGSSGDEIVIGSIKIKIGSGYTIDGLLTQLNLAANTWHYVELHKSETTTTDGNPYCNSTLVKINGTYVANFLPSFYGSVLGTGTVSGYAYFDDFIFSCASYLGTACLTAFPLPMLMTKSPPLQADFRIQNCQNVVFPSGGGDQRIEFSVLNNNYIMDKVNRGTITNPTTVSIAYLCQNLNIEIKTFNNTTNAYVSSFWIREIRLRLRDTSNEHLMHFCIASSSMGTPTSTLSWQDRELLVSPFRMQDQSTRSVRFSHACTTPPLAACYANNWLPTGEGFFEYEV